MAGCYGGSTAIFARALGWLGVGEEAAAVGGGMMGLVCALGLLWALRSRARRSAMARVRSGPT